MGEARKEFLNRELWVEAWRYYRTAEKVAKFMKCSRPTVYNYAKYHNIKLKQGPKRGSPVKQTKLKKYLLQHRDAMSLPSAEIARRAGVSYNTVKCYTYRLRLKARQVVGSQPWRHTGPPHLLVDVNGVRVPDRAFDVVRAFISRWGSIQLMVRCKTGGQYTFRYSAIELEDVYRRCL
jgi:hypothetical protein